MVGNWSKDRRISGDFFQDVAEARNDVRTRTHWNTEAAIIWNELPGSSIIDDDRNDTHDHRFEHDRPAKLANTWKNESIGRSECIANIFMGNAAGEPDCVWPGGSRRLLFKCRS